MSSSTNLEEQQYLDMIRRILAEGYWEEGRNGRTQSLFGHTMRFSLRNGALPLLTTKRVAWKTCLKELLWFIRGDMNNKRLKEQGVHIWDANGTREFLDSRGLHDFQEDELGCIYGYQWRHFNKPYVSANSATNLSADKKETSDKDKYADQLRGIIDALKDPAQRTSRRLIMTAWNPNQLHLMALPPCHVLCQFNVHAGNQLSCLMYQRSADAMLGEPFNIASYAMLTHLLAAHCGLQAHELVCVKGNCHIYETHIEGAKEQIERVPFAFPSLRITQTHERIEDYQVEDFEVQGYRHHPTIAFNMVA